MADTHAHDPLQPHAHDPNPEPPSPDSHFELYLPGATGGGMRTVGVSELAGLPQTDLPDCYIVSTGHGTSGPFTFGGVTLRDFLAAFVPAEEAWNQVEVVSADGFGTRVWRGELAPVVARPILLATRADGQPLTRREGLVRLIVPSETDDALRQVKWVGRINVVAVEPKE